jgi:FSR family fosmidomycin resistance protein-like MFS transporter
MTVESPPRPSPVAGGVPARGSAFGLALLAVGHAVTDSYGQSLLAPMYPAFMARLGLSLAQVGSLAMIMGLSASLAQPLIGWISDRYPRWCMVAFGPLFAALMVGSVGHVHSYWQLAAVMFAAGIGIGAYHPQGAMLAKQAGRGSGLAMSAFTVGGNIGFGLAPLLSGLYLTWFGLEHLYFAAAPAALFAAVMLGAFYSRNGYHAAASRRGAGQGAGKGDPAALAFLTATVVVRSAVQTGIITFLPILVQQRFPPAQRDTITHLGLSAFILAAAFAGPLGGHLSDRYGARRVMLGSFLAAPWPLLFGLAQPGYGVIALLAFGAFLLMLPHPANVVMAQDLMPRSAGIAASMITGLAFGLGQILALPLGEIAEVTGLHAALMGLCLVPLLGIPLVPRIPDRRPTTT